MAWFMPLSLWIGSSYPFAQRSLDEVPCNCISCKMRLSKHFSHCNACISCVVACDSLLQGISPYRRLTLPIFNHNYSKSLFEIYVVLAYMCAPRTITRIHDANAHLVIGKDESWLIDVGTSWYQLLQVERMKSKIEQEYC